MAQNRAEWQAFVNTVRIKSNGSLNGGKVLVDSVFASFSSNIQHHD